jgi:hypothetical protein
MHLVKTSSRCYAFGPRNNDIDPALVLAASGLPLAATQDGGRVLGVEILLRLHDHSIAELHSPHIEIVVVETGVVRPLRLDFEEHLVSFGNHAAEPESQAGGKGLQYLAGNVTHLLLCVGARDERIARHNVYAPWGIRIGNCPSIATIRCFDISRDYLLVSR